MLAQHLPLGVAAERNIAVEALEQQDATRLVPATAEPPGSPEARRIVWLFVGGGALYKPFEDEVKRRGLRSVQFRPYQPRERLAESLSAGDVHLISLRPEFEGLVVPSKYYGILAAGRPTLFVGAADGEIARNLALNRTGLSVAMGDGAALAKAVVELSRQPDRVREMGVTARAVFERDFTRETSIARWSALLQVIRTD